VKGAIKADDPSKYTVQAAQCTGSPMHTAVWILQLEAAGQQLLVPAYVDAVTNPAEAALGSLKITVCLPSPYIPQSAGGAALGAKLVSATLHLTNVLVLPGQSGEYGWTLVATPYTVGTATVNAAGTVQARAFVRLPVLLSIGAKFVRKPKSYTLAGRLTENLTGLGGFSVQIFGGPSASKLKRIKTVKTKVGGTYSLKVGAKATRYYQARVVVPVRNAPCTGGVPGLNCVSGTLDPWSARSRAVKAAKRK